ncbi:MAG: aldo/keto reductase [Blautia sp.]
MEYITLNNGVKMPAVGFGVFRITDEVECEEAVLKAIQAGYRHIDTASAYGNEKAVGKAIERCGIPREKLFVTTKLWISDTNYEGAKKAFEKSLQNLGIDYVDLYLIHQPYNDYYGAWRALEELYNEGKIRAIGVDNFTQERLADFITFNKIKPAINLIEANPLYQRHEDFVYMEEKEIQMEAWSPLAAGKDNLFTNPILLELSEKYNKSVAQIVLRWLFQRKIISVAKTTHFNQMKENIDIFDFVISENDMRKIMTLDTKQSCFPARIKGKEVESFLNEENN